MEGFRTTIKRYLRANPLAADTAKGIATCWLPSYGIEPTYEPFVEALQAMVLSEELCEVELPGGELLYRRGPALEID